MQSFSYYTQAEAIVALYPGTFEHQQPLVDVHEHEVPLDNIETSLHHTESRIIMYLALLLPILFLV